MKRIWILLILFGFALVTVMFFINGASAAHTIDFYSKLAFGQPYTEIFCEGDFTGIDLLARIDENDTGGVVTVTNTQYDFDNTHLHFSDTTNAEIVQKQIQFSGDTFIGYKLYHLLLFTNNTNVFFNDTSFHCSGEFRLNKYYAYGEDGCTIYIDRCKFTDEELTAGNRLFLGLNSATQIKYYVSNSTFIHVSFQYDNITMENSFLFGKARVGTAIANGVAYLDNVYIADWQQGIAYTDVKSANAVTVANNLYGFGVVAGANRLFENCNAVGNTYLVFILAVSGDYHFTNTYSDTWEVYGSYALVTLHRNYTVDINVQDEDGSVDGATVTITNATGTVMYTDTTDADGKIVTCDLNVSYRNLKGWEHNNPFTINVSEGGDRFLEFEQPIWDATNWTLYLPQAEVVPDPCPDCPAGGDPLQIWNPNPARNTTDFTNRLTSDPLGLFTSVDVWYNNFTGQDGYEQTTQIGNELHGVSHVHSSWASQTFVPGTERHIGEDFVLTYLELNLSAIGDEPENLTSDYNISICDIFIDGFPDLDNPISVSQILNSTTYFPVDRKKIRFIMNPPVMLFNGVKYAITMHAINRESASLYQLGWYFRATNMYTGGHMQTHSRVGGWVNSTNFDFDFKLYGVSGWNKIVNLSFYNGSDSVLYGVTYAYQNGTYDVFNSNFSQNYTQYLWNVTANSNSTLWVNKSYNFETGEYRPRFIPLMISSMNQKSSASVIALAGFCMITFAVVKRRRREREYDD